MVDIFANILLQWFHEKSKYPAFHNDNNHIASAVRLFVLDGLNLVL